MYVAYRNCILKKDSKYLHKINIFLTVWQRKPVPQNSKDQIFYTECVRWRHCSYLSVQVTMMNIPVKEHPTQQYSHSFLSVKTLCGNSRLQWQGQLCTLEIHRIFSTMKMPFWVRPTVHLAPYLVTSSGTTISNTVFSRVGPIFYISSLLVPAISPNAGNLNVKFAVVILCCIKQV